jgi:hypothetical protein
MPAQAAAGLRRGGLAGCCRVVLAARDFLALSQPVFFGLAVRDTGRRGGQLAIAGVMACVLLIGVLAFGVAADAGCHGCAFCWQDPRGANAQPGSVAGSCRPPHARWPR